MDATWWAAGLALGVIVGVQIGECGTLDKSNRQACELACARNGAGKRHSSDETWCMCTSGTALKRDRSRLYVKLNPTHDASARGAK